MNRMSALFLAPTLLFSLELQTQAPPGARTTKPVEAAKKGVEAAPEDLKSDADIAREEKREKTAADRFLSVLEKSPRKGTALDRVYGYYVERGAIEEFVKGYSDRAAKNADDGAAWLVLGLLESQRSRDAAAVEAFRKAEAARPKDPIPSYYLGQALVLIGRPEDAAEAFERAIGKKPNRTDLLEIFQSLGRIYEKTNRSDRAKDVWKRLEALFPEDTRVREQIASILSEESKPEQALERYESLIKEVKDEFRKVQLKIEAADLKVKLGKTTAALADFESLLGELNPESWLYREVRSKIEDVFLRNDDLAGLTKYYEDWIKKNPDDVEALTRVGRTLASQGRAGDARGWFEKAVKLAPSRKDLRLALVEQFTQEKKFAEAAKQFEELSKTDPNNPDMLREWGKLLLMDSAKPEAERRDAARSVWRKMVEAKPKDPVATAQVADLFRASEMTDDAIAYYKRAIELAPDAPQYREYLGEYYHSLKKPNEALETWNGIAGGANKNAKNLGRLGEVLKGFGFVAEADASFAEACRLAPDDFELRIQRADTLYQLGKYAEVDAELGVAGKLALDDDQAETVFTQQVRNDQASDKVTERIASLKKDVAGAQGAKASPGWVKLARYLEAEHNLAEATAAANRAVELDPRSAVALATLARLAESSGNLGGAVEAFRKLADVDRRSRSEYLTNIAKLEARLGRREQALKAGKELLASAPGNPEHYEFYSELCFQLGEPNEGLEILRRAVRVNPSETKTLLTLAETLASQFRTDEAIELYWRAFDKAKDLEARLSAVSRLTDLHLQQNRFDRLTSRLERQFGENDRKREAAICLAQAYAASGDYGAARRGLEQLLTSNTRDAQVLQQLASLAEAEADYASAAKYQKQIMEAAPTEEGMIKLAQMYVRAQDYGEAEAIWSRQAAEDKDEGRILEAIDNLIANNKPEPVLAITDRLVRKQPGDWEALYREGTALALMNRNEDAARRFRAILDLKLNDDDKGQISLARNRTNKRPAGIRTASGTKPRTFPLADRVNNVWALRNATRIQSQYYYGGAQARWAPEDFGQARMASLASLYAGARKQGRQDELLKSMRESRAKNAKDARLAWDWFYLQIVRDGSDVYEAAKDLATAAANDPGAQWAYLTNLSRRVNEDPNIARSAQGPGKEDTTPPLASGEIDSMLEGLQLLERRRPEWIDSNIVESVATELKRAKRTDAADALFKRTVDAANQLDDVANAMMLSADRGDVELTLRLFDKYERLLAGRPMAYNFFGTNMASPIHALCTLMRKRADEKAYPDAIKILDRFLLTARRNRESSGARSKSRSYGNPWGGGYAAYQVALSGSKNFNYIQFDYPSSNSFYDYGALTILRNAYEMLQSADVLSDLVDHFKKRLAKPLDDLDAVYSLLGLSYLHWWNDEKDDAVEFALKASEKLPSDVDLRLAAAELREKQGDNDQALALIDAVDPLDTQTMQQRELIALRLAVSLGNVDRARLASERLFGLRLDTNMQIQLAGRMHQLGMHDLAETVLVRARRRSGNRLDALVALMNQYQQQGQNDISVQVAHQILRRSAAKSSNPYVYDPNANSRQAAIQTLSRSGKVKDLIERVEAQLEKAPGSLQLLQELSDYYAAAGETKKQKDTLDRIIKLRPDDANLRIQIADRLSNDGEYEKSLEHYRLAIKKDPSLLQMHLWQILQAHRMANKNEDLIKLFDELDLGSLSNPYMIGQILGQLFNDPETRDPAIALFRKAWKALPETRQFMLVNLNNQSIWRLPEMFDFAVESILPIPDQSRTPPWHGLNNVIYYNPMGRVGTTTTQVIDAAAAQDRLVELVARIDQGLKEHPEWLAGKVIKAIIQCRDEASAQAGVAALKEMLNKDKAPLPPSLACQIIAQQIEGDDELRPIALDFYRAALREGEDLNNGQYAFSPAASLINLAKKMGLKELAREELLKFKKRPGEVSLNPSYASYLKCANLLAIAQEFKSLGFPVDALSSFNELFSELEAMPGDANYGVNKDQMLLQAQTAMTKILDSLEGEKYAEGVRELIRPLKPRGPKEAGGGHVAKPAQAIDLAVFLNPRDFEHGRFESVVAKALKSAVRDKKLPKEIKEELARLESEHPLDLSARITLLIAAQAEEDREACGVRTRELLKIVEDTPLEPLAAGVRANSRQRDAAARQMGLWLVARELLDNDSTRSQAETLAERAIEAASRQTDKAWVLTMLREKASAELERGDKAGAEKNYARMLEIILPPPAASKNKEKQRAAAAPAAAPAMPAAAPAAAPATAPGAKTAAPSESRKNPDAQPTTNDKSPQSSALRSAGARTRIALLRSPAADGTVRRTALQTTTKAITLRKAAPAQAAPVATKSVVIVRYNAPAATQDKFQQAMQFANLAVENDLTQLSVKATLDVLRGGPPANGGNAMMMNQGMAMIQPGIVLNDQMMVNGVQVEDRVSRLVNLWKRKGVPADTVYNVLREIVLPEGRPSEIFPYANLLQTSRLRRPRSLALVLVQEARRANRLDDLKTKVEARSKQPLAELQALLLLIRIDRAKDDDKGFAEHVQALQARLEKDTLQTSAEAAAAVALELLGDSKQFSAPAFKLLERSVRNFDPTMGQEPLGSLRIILARSAFEQGDAKEGVRLLREYLSAMDKTIANYGSNVYYFRKQFLERAAAECAAAGFVEESLSFLGEFVDLPKPSENNGFASPATASLDALAVAFASKDAQTRYNLLKAWTVPDEKRKSIRIAADPGSIVVPPEAFLPASKRAYLAVADGGDEQLRSTADWLINAARECGKLDELAAEANKAAEAKLENGAAFRVLVEIAAGRDDALEKEFSERVEAARKALPPKSADDAMGVQRRQATPVSPADCLVARAGMKSKSSKISAKATQLAEILLEHSSRTNGSGEWILRKPLALAETGNESAAGVEPDGDPHLAHWTPGEANSPNRHRVPGSVWMIESGAPALARSSGRSELFFDYPLAGDFTFSIDSFEAEGFHGALSFAGLDYETASRTQVPRLVNGGYMMTSETTLLESLSSNRFNRLTLEVKNGSVRQLINGREVQEDDEPSATSPWLSLYTEGSRSVWRNPKLIGAPTIPREVALISDDSFDGWSPVGQETVPPHRTNPSNARRRPARRGRVVYGRRSYVLPTQPLQEYDWSVKDGVLSALPSPLQQQTIDMADSLLRLNRPLRNGESISYEFFYSPNDCRVDPVIGRSAFLIDESGVKEHLIAHMSTQVDPFGYRGDNAVAIEANRKGEVRLKANDWNAVKLAVSAAGALALELNGTLIYERALDRGEDRRFAFLRDRELNEVRVRKVVLRGDWPETLTPELLADLFKVDGSFHPEAPARRAAYACFEGALDSLVREVLVESAKLSDLERYQRLERWVLPSEDHGDFRIGGIFHSGEDPQKPVFESPAIELCELAQKLSKAEELKAKIAAAQAEGDARRREQAALAASLAATVNDAAGTTAAVDRLIELTKAQSDHAAIRSRLPQIAAVAALLRHPEAREPATRLAKLIAEAIRKRREADRPAAGDEQWSRIALNLLARLESGTKPERYGDDPGLDGWKAFSAISRKARLAESSPARWSFSNGELAHWPGRDQDFLYYKTPLRGDFEIECELSGTGVDQIRIFYAGVTATLLSKKVLEIRHVDGEHHKVSLKPELETIPDWFSYRLSVKAGMMTVTIAGQKAFEEKISAKASPWLFLFQKAEGNGKLRGLAIKGALQIPEKVELSAGATLAGWSETGGLPEEDENTFNRFDTQVGEWTKEGAAIKGEAPADEQDDDDISLQNGFNRFNQPAEAINQAKPKKLVNLESVLRHHKPIDESAEIEYEFFYEKGKTECHPVLGSVVYLIGKEGITEHELAKESLELDRDAAAVSVHKDRRLVGGDGSIALVDRGWNKVKITRTGEKAVIAINGKPAYETKVDASAPLAFGFFRYLDKTGARIRKVFVRGGYGTTPPSGALLREPVKP